MTATEAENVAANQPQTPTPQQQATQLEPKDDLVVVRRDLEHMQLQCQNYLIYAKIQDRMIRSVFSRLVEDIDDYLPLLPDIIMDPPRGYGANPSNV